MGDNILFEGFIDESDVFDSKIIFLDQIHDVVEHMLTTKSWHYFLIELSLLVQLKGSGKHHPREFP